MDTYTRGKGPTRWTIPEKRERG